VPSCPRPCKIQTGRDRTIHRCLSSLQINTVLDISYVPSVLNNHTNSQMLSNCNTAATQILNISHSKERKPKNRALLWTQKSSSPLGRTVNCIPRREDWMSQSDLGSQVKLRPVQMLAQRWQTPAGASSRVDCRGRRSCCWAKWYPWRTGERYPSPQKF